MVRTVRVRLELDRDDYRRGLRDAASDTRGFDGEVRSAGKDVGAMGVEVKSTGTQIESMGRQVDTTGGRTRQFGTETENAKAKMVNLASEITKTKDSLKGLGEEFRHTGQVNLGELNRLSSGLRELERAKATIGKLLPDNNNGGFGSTIAAIGTFLADLGRLGPATLNAGGSLLDAAKSIATTIGTGVKDGLSSLSSLVQGGFKQGLDALSGSVPDSFKGYLIAGAVAAAPAIGAAVNAGILLGVGGAGLAGGILLASRDARVKDAWTQFGQAAMDQLNAAAGVFVGPLTRAADTFGAAFDSIMPSIRRDFAALAPVVDDIARGFGGFLANMMPGFDRAIQAAVPLLRQVGAELPKLGSAMSSFFDSIARGGPGATMFFHDLMTDIDVMIVGVGKLVEWLSKAWELRDKVLRMSDGMDTVAKWLGIGGDKAKDAAGKLDDLGTSADGVVAPLDGASQAVGRLEGSFRNAIQQAGYFTQTLDNINGGNIALATSQINVESALQRFKDALKESGGSLDIHTEKGRAAKQAALDLTTATGDLAQKTYEQSGSASQGSKVLDQYRQQLENAMVQSGMTKEAAHALADQWLHMPDSVSTQVNAPGLAQTKADAADAYRGLDKLDGKTADTYVRNHIVTYYENGTPQMGHSRYGPNGDRWGNVYEHAAVGVLREASTYSARNPGRYMIAEPETGGEAFVPRRGDYGRSMSILNHAASWYGARVVPAGAGGGVANVTVNVNAGMGVDGPALGRQIAAVLRPYIRSVGGGNVQAALGRG